MANSSDRHGLGALAVYSTLSLLFFGRGLIGHFCERYMGFGPDPGLGIEILAWWPYALSHRLNPLIATTLWAPSGFNLTWATCFPLPALVMTPVTVLFGAIASYNAVMLASPALSAWTAFLLCRYVSKCYWPSIAGGYIFGFSAYVLGHIISNLQFAVILLIPLVLYAALRYLDGTLTPIRFFIYLTLLLLGEFLISLEILAIMTIFGGAALLIAYGAAEKNLRDRIRGSFPIIAGAYAATGILMSPYLCLFFLSSFGWPPQMPRGLTDIDVIYPLNVCLATALNLLGVLYKPHVVWLGLHVYNSTGYIGFPLLIVLVHFAYQRRRDPRASLTVLVFLIACIASFGVTFWYGNKLLHVPWAFLFHLPLLDHAMPSRFTFVGFLCLAMIASLWLSDTSIRRSVRMIAASMMLVSLLPNPAKAFWYTEIDAPAFFSDGLYKQYLLPNDNVVILPYEFNGDSAIWQAMTRMYFRMASGDISLMSPVPQKFEHWSVIYTFFDLGEIPDEGEQLKAFLVQNNVSAVIVTDEGRHVWRPFTDPGPVHYLHTGFYGYEEKLVRSLLGALGVAPIRVGGVAFYRVPLGQLAAYKSLDAGKLEEKCAVARLDAMIIGANAYFERGLSVDPESPNESINLHKLADMGLLPRSWVAGPWIRGNSRWPVLIDNGLFMDAFPNGKIAIGVLGSRDVLQRVALKYKSDAVEVVVMPPREIGSNADSSRWMLAALYDRKRLSQAAQAANNGGRR
jgi:hypothetical protein